MNEDRNRRKERQRKGRGICEEEERKGEKEAR